jgi:hypothetical protein
MTPFYWKEKQRFGVGFIEEAEELTFREEVTYSNLSMLLNLTDGLLGESLRFKSLPHLLPMLKYLGEAPAA